MLIGEIIRRKQPDVYLKLMAMCYVHKAENPDKAFKDIENLMRHDAYVRERGAIRQIRHQ